MLSNNQREGKRRFQGSGSQINQREGKQTLQSNNQIEDNNWGKYQRNQNDISEYKKLYTLFIDNIPENMDKMWLLRIFNDYGVVKETFLTIKRSKKGSRFAFVKYDCPISSEMAIFRAIGMKLEGQRIL